MCCESQGWSFQGTSECWHACSSTKYFQSFGAGDVVSMEIDIDADTLSFFINGEPGGVVSVEHPVCTF